MISLEGEAKKVRRCLTNKRYDQTERRARFKTSLLAHQNKKNREVIKQGQMPLYTRSGQKL